MSNRSVSATRLTRELANWREGQSRRRPAFRALAERIEVLAQDGRLPMGMGLPGERELATALDVSRTTVTSAYSLLRETGYLDSRQGARSTIAIPRGDVAAASTGLRFGPAASAPDGLIDLSYAAPAALPQVGAAYRRALELLPEHLAGHGLGVVGIEALREAIARRYTERGLPTRPPQILVTNGAQQAMTLVVDTLLSPGDRVLFDHPTYPHALEAVTAMGGRPVPVPVRVEDDPGWDLDGMQAAIRQLAPRLAYLVVDHHNPTGLLLDDEGRHDLVALARAARLTLVVDESLAELTLDGPRARPAAAFGNVISIGSVSKLMWGGLRIGWIRADEATIRRLGNARAPRDLGAPPLEQLTAALLLADVDELISDRVAQYRQQRAAMVESLRLEAPDWHWVRGSGGLCLWVQLPTPVSSRLAMAAPDFGVAVTAGPRFGVNGAFEQWLRLPYVHRPEQIALAVRQLVRAYEDVTTRGGVHLREPALVV